MNTIVTAPSIYHYMVLGRGLEVTISPTGRDLAEATTEELTKIKGLGKIKAGQLVCAIELGKRICAAPASESVSIRCPQDVVDLNELQDMSLLDREQMRIILLNTKNVVLQTLIISMGTLNSSPVHPKEVFKMAIKRSAAAIIIVHNHPSNCPEPSNEDHVVSKRIAEAGKLLGIELFDSIILAGHGKYVSLKEKGIL